MMETLHKERSDVPYLIDQAMINFEKGAVEKAETLCHHVLSVDFNNAEALHILGVIAFESQNLQKAFEYIQKAIHIRSDHPIYHISLGDIFRANSDFPKALKAYQNAIDIKETSSDAHFRMALIHQRASDLKAASHAYEKAIQYQPDFLEAHFNVASIYLEQGELNKAAEAFQKVIALQPDFSKAHYFSGVVLHKLKKTDQAICHYQNALKYDPNNAYAAYNMAIAFEDTHHIDHAIKAYGIAIKIDANYWAAHYNLANLEKSSGNSEKALRSYEKVISLNPDLFQAYNNMALIYKEAGKLTLAADLLNKTLLIEPQCVEAHYNLGIIYQLEGNLENARRCYRKALDIDPDYTQAKWLSHLALPILYGSEEEIRFSRKVFDENLDRLIDDTPLLTDEDHNKALKGASEVTNFYLQYQGQNDITIQKKFGQFIREIMAANYPQWAMEKNMPPVEKGKKIRLGYLSSFMYAHTVGEFLKGWLEAHNKALFEIYSYDIGTRQDFVTDAIEKESNYFRKVNGSLEQIAGQIISDDLHILIYTDIGMNAITTQLAALNLAPIQCKGWGHPVTTGLPTIDYYLSSDLMEPANASEHYSEHLVKLPNLALSYTPPPLPEPIDIKQNYGFTEKEVLYLSSQSLFKYLPQYDDIYPKIAKALPSARFIFIANKSEKVTAHFENRLKTSFKSYGLNAQQWVTIMPRLSFSEFLNLNLQSDILLDTFEWSGGKTTLEALSCGVPVVTCPGQMMRGRHAYAFLKKMGLTDTIAANKKAYIATAVKLGKNLKFRENIKTHILTHRNCLYKDTSFMEWLENFYRSIVFQHQRRSFI